MNSSEKYRLLFDTARDAIFLGDVETGILIDCNVAAEELAMRKKTEIVGQHQSILHPKRVLKDGISPTFHEHRQGNESLLEEEILRSDGTIRNVSIQGNIIEWEGRQVVQGIFRDITEHKQAQDELRESEEMHRALFQLSQDALMILAPPSWDFTAGNPAAYKMYGAKDEADFSSHSPWEFSPEFQPDNRLSSEKAQEMIDTAMRVGIHSFDWEHMTLAGVQFPCVVTLMRMTAAGKPFLQATVKDMSEIRRIEKEKATVQAQLIHSSKLASIGTLAACVAHEINNPLAIINGNFFILEKRIKQGASPEALAEIMAKQQYAVDRIVNIVDQLRTYARADTEIVQEVNLNKVVNDTLGMVNAIFTKGGLKISTALNSKGIVNANIGKIQQVVLNLLTNARDALEGVSEGLIKIETSDDNGVVLQILDNGSGIPENVLPTIFDAFFTTKDPGKGTGLGLSISQALVTSFGGTITVESEVGLGTTFTVRLPASTHRTGPVEEVRQALPCLSGTALVVDDESGIRDILKEFLTELGMTVTTANDGEEGMAILRGMTFDYVLTDLKMPKMDGDIMLAAAKSLPHLTTTKFLVVTGGIITDYTKEQRDHIRRLADGYLRKPFRIADIAAAIEATHMEM